jgi:N-acetylmuramic acid 6-phosphate (MurNAc-6-P) etherase
VSGNRMSNLQPRNVKLRERAVRIVMAEMRVDQQTAVAALKSSNWNVQRALKDLASKDL